MLDKCSITELLLALLCFAYKSFLEVIHKLILKVRWKCNTPSIATRQNKAERPMVQHYLISRLIKIITHVVVSWKQLNSPMEQNLEPEVGPHIYTTNFWQRCKLNEVNTGQSFNKGCCNNWIKMWKISTSIHIVYHMKKKHPQNDHKPVQNIENKD
jgi:hypothetical protein